MGALGPGDVFGSCVRQDTGRSAVVVDDERCPLVPRTLLQVQAASALVGPDEGLDELVCRVGEDLGRCSGLGDDSTLLEDDHLVGEGERLVDVVGDEDDGLAELALQAVELGLQIGADDRVDGTEGLVHQQDVRVARQCAGDADALLLAAGELSGVALRERAVQAHLVQELERLGAGLRLGHALEHGDRRDVVDDAAVRQEAGGLQDVADASAQLHLVLRRDVDVIDEDLA